jgi:hypothetical protein
MAKTKCVDCKYLGIKDFVYGYCKNSKSKIFRVQIDTSCKYGKLREGGKINV